jgi:hypothetical protein
MIDAAKYDDIIYYSNDSSNLHCFPATFAMMLSKLMPEKNIDLAEAIRLCDTAPGMAVWPSRMLVELKQMGLDVVMIEGFNAQAFIEDGAKYLKREFGKDVSDWQIAHSNIPKEQKDYKAAIDAGIDIKNTIPTKRDMESLLAQGWLVQCVVNSRRLANKEGYVGHSVLVLEVSEQHVLLHNPGLPPKPYQEVSAEDFEAAWAYPNDKAKSLIALKRTKQAVGEA